MREVRRRVIPVSNLTIKDALINNETRGIKTDNFDRLDGDKSKSDVAEKKRRNNRSRGRLD